MKTQLIESPNTYTMYITQWNQNVMQLKNGNALHFCYSFVENFFLKIDEGRGEGNIILWLRHHQDS